MSSFTRMPASVVRRSGVAGTVAAVGALAGMTSPVAGTVVVLGAVALYVALLLVHRAERRRRHLEDVHEFTRALGSAAIDGTVIPAVLGSMGSLLQVERCGLYLLADLAVHPGGGGGSLVRAPGAQPIDAATLRSLIDALPSDRWGGAHVTAEHPVAQLAGVSDALVVRLGTLTDPFGLLVAADRPGGAERFDEGDLELLRVMASHAGAAIASDLAVARLRRQTETQTQRAFSDRLTGLPNREGLLHRLDRDLRSTATGQSVGVLVIDLAGFQQINEGLGLVLADRYLVSVAERIRAAAPESAVVARTGGDEFAVTLVSPRVRDELAETVRAIAISLGRPVSIGDVEVDAAATFGVAIAPDHGDSAAVLLQRAGVAQATAARTGKLLVTYTRREADEAPARLATVAELRRAIAEGQVVPYYQPKIDLETGRTVGCEALVRWFHPERGMISPAEFIPLAEQTGLIGPLTETVLKSAISQLARWNADGHDIGVSVNLSARNLADGTLAQDVALAVHAAGVRPDRLTLEVTESMVMDSGRAVRTLERLDELGVKVSIDDFGTGYSSLANLRSMPVSELKIDRSFVMRLPAEPEDQVIVRSTLDLAKSLGLLTVAEGVEDVETMDLLAEMGADVVQGFHCGRPMPASDLTQRLQDEADQAAAEERRRVVVSLPSVGA